MNNWSQWEKQLQSWIPRRPSAELTDRFIPKPLIAAEPEVQYSFWFRMAPVTCVALVISAILMAGNDAQSHLLLISPGNSNMLASLSSSDPNLLPGLASDGRCQELNVLAAATFDWTKASPSLSITGSFPLWKTNTQKL
ncbi:MAG: hypothetical protein JWQ71_5096 [Pedosphaera sp.]|nr:hypothetical protein [Pedosphaera sp.]